MSESGAASALATAPRTAPNVHLAGEMPDVAFRDRQWIVQRGDGRFIQLSEVLYLILENADGRRTAGEIADVITARTEWSVDDETIRTLIAAKLVPLRLIHTSSSMTRPADDDPQSASSILDVNARMRMLPIAAINAVTSRLQWLFFPPLMTVLLLAVAAAHVWMYSAFAIRQTIADVMYTPGSLLAVFGILIAAALVHEVGHASALRYGGGRVRGMGAGLYLIFPAFYTDVTDSYRLGRGARIRTDLGGIYFHMLCTVGLIGLAAHSHRDVFLLSAFLIDVEALRQFVPFVRLDGYWLLADATGIPDFFSQMGPFIKSLLPARRRPSGETLPPLKPAATAVFVLYIVAVVPTLAYLLFQVFANAPELVTTTARALSAQAHLLLTSPQVLIRMLALTQMFFLAAPLGGSILMLALALGGAWRIAGPLLPQRARRFAAATALASVGGVMLAGIHPGAADPRSERGEYARAEMLLTEARRATAALDAIEADVEGRAGTDRFKGRIALKRPNLAHVEIHGDPGLGDFIINSNGSDLIVYFPDERQYVRTPVRSDGRNINAFVVAQVAQFFDPDSIGATTTGARIADRSEAPLDGAFVHVFLPAAGVKKRPAWLRVSRSDRLVHRIVWGSRFDDDSENAAWAELRHVKVGTQARNVSLDWRVPAGASAMQLPVAGLTGLAR